MRKVHGWRRARRWIVGIVGSLLGLVALALLAAFVVLQTGWGHGLLRDQIEARLDSTFVGGAKLGGVEGNPFTELVLTDLVLNGPDGKPAIRVDRLTVKLPLLPLISHQLRVEKLIVDGLDVHARKLASGEYQLAHLTRPSSPSTWDITLPDVVVHDGHVHVDQGTGREPIDLDDLELTANANAPFTGPLDATVQLTGEWRQKHAPISVGAIIHGDDEAFSVRNAAVRVGDVRALALGVRVPKTAYAKPVGGTVAVTAPAKSVRALLPSVRLPADVALSVSARPEGRLTYFSLFAAVGHGDIRAFGRADIQARLASVMLAATDLDLARLTNGRVGGHGGAFATLQLDASPDAELPTAAGVATVWSDLPDAPPVNVVIGFDSGGDRIRAALGAASAGGLRAGIGATLRKHGDVIELERGDLIARTLDVRRATAGQTPVRGVLNANLHAEGRLSPDPDLAIAGVANGRRLRFAGASARRLALNIHARHVPGHPIGSGRLELYDIDRGDLAFSKLTVAAGNRPDGKIQVSVRSQPKPAPWRIDLDALITTGETIVVDLQRHFVRMGGGAIWRGRTGTVTIGPREITLRDLRSTSSEGHISADASYVRAGRHRGDLSARVDAVADLDHLAEGPRGHVEAHVDVRRRGRELTGEVVANASEVKLAADSPITFGGKVQIDARPKQLRADVGVTTAKSGRARLALDVDAPRDLTDLRAWRTLGRDSIRTAQLTLTRVELADIAKAADTAPMSGLVDGTLELSPAKADGVIELRDLSVPQMAGLGIINADLRVGQGGDGALETALSMRLVPSPNAVAAQDVTRHGEARLFAEARLMTPDRIFDPSAWQRLGHDAFRGGRLRAEGLAFEPGTLQRLGVVSQLRGELAIAAELDEGLDAVRFAVNLYNLRGGLLAKPVSIAVAGAVDDRSTRVNADLRAKNITLLHASSELPITLERLRTNRAGIESTPLDGRIRIAQVPAVALMNVIGTSQITGGTLDGTIELGGSIGRPTAEARLVARDVTVPSGGSFEVQHVQRLAVSASWNGTEGRVAIDGDETGGGKLNIRASGSPDRLDRITASVYASKLDIAPLVAFMPGPAGGLAGRLDANFTLRGANPKTAELAGKLRITNGRIPVAPAVGTLFQGDLRIDVQNHVFGLALTGKLGNGDVKATASAPLQGVTPRSGKLKLTVRDVQLIGKTEPILSGVVDADIARIGDTWRSNVRVDGMTVKIPEQKGTKLSPVGPPDDLVFGGLEIHHGKHHGQDVPAGVVSDQSGPQELEQSPQVEGPVPHRSVPRDPVLVANVRIRNVFVESGEIRGLVGGRLQVTIGQAKQVAILGNVGLSRGVLDLFGRRYQVDRAQLHFDGSTDPVVDVRITYDFPEVTTITEVHGRISKPELQMTSEPATYSQAELLGFLLGGEPSGDPEQAPSATERVTSAGTSFIGNKIGGYVRRALPVDIDVLRYEAGTSTTSAAVTVGTWITDTLFLAYRQHLEARPDENTGEGQVQYWLQRRLVLEGVIGDRGVNSADLLWRRRW